MNSIKKETDKLIEVIDNIVREFAEERATVGIGTEEHDPLSVDEAMEYASDKCDNEEVYQAVDNLFKSIVREKWESYINSELEDYSLQKSQEETENYYRRAKI